MILFLHLEQGCWIRQNIFNILSEMEEEMWRNRRHTTIYITVRRWSDCNCIWLRGQRVHVKVTGARNTQAGDGRTTRGKQSIGSTLVMHLQDYYLAKINNIWRCDEMINNWCFKFDPTNKEKMQIYETVVKNTLT